MRARRKNQCSWLGRFVWINLGRWFNRKHKDKDVLNFSAPNPGISHSLFTGVNSISIAGMPTNALSTIMGAVSDPYLNYFKQRTMAGLGLGGLAGGLGGNPLGNIMGSGISSGSIATWAGNGGTYGTTSGAIPQNFFNQYYQQHNPMDDDYKYVIFAKCFLFYQHHVYHRKEQIGVCYGVKLIKDEFRTVAQLPEIRVREMLSFENLERLKELSETGYFMVSPDEWECLPVNDKNEIQHDEEVWRLITRFRHVKITVDLPRISEPDHMEITDSGDVMFHEVRGTYEILNH